MNENKELSYIDKKLLVLDQSKKDIQAIIETKVGPDLQKMAEIDKEIEYLTKMKADIEGGVSPDKPALHWKQRQKLEREGAN